MDKILKKKQMVKDLYNQLSLPKRIVKKVYNNVYTGKTKTVRCCPICGWKGQQFKLAGGRLKQRFDAQCPNCGSMERHRLAYLVATKCKDLDYSKVLHVAPEKQISKWLRSRSEEYLSIDLNSEAMVKMDITNLEIEDMSQTLIWASHVLEHVIDDSKAISEMYRVLKPNGIAFIQVPIWRFKTFENFKITKPEERLKTFYQKDHVRLYGLDIVDRFEKTGFSTEIHRAQDFGPELLLKHSLSFASTNEVFVFQK